MFLRSSSHFHYESNDVVVNGEIKHFSVYDVSNRQTFERLGHWMNEVDTYSTKTDAVKMLIGNKIDIVSFLIINWKRCIYKEEMRQVY